MPKIKVLTNEELERLTNGHKIDPGLLAQYEPLLKPLKKGETCQVELEPGEERAKVKADFKRVAEYLELPIIFRNHRGGLLIFDVREPTAEENARWKSGDNRRGKTKK